MDLISLSLLAVTILLLYQYFRFYRKLGHFPPCPVRPWPIIGNLLALSSDQKTQFRQWRKQCGDVFSVHVGPRLLVVISGYDLIKETFIKRADEFSDRPPLFFDELMNYQGKGIAFNIGPVWKEQRAVSISILRKFGLGKNVLAERVQEEIKYYLDRVSTHGGQPMDFKSITMTSVANIICSIMTGQRFDYTDPLFLKLVEEIDIFSHSNGQAALFTTIPALKYLPGNFLNNKGIKRNLTEIFRICQIFINMSNDKDPDDNFISTYMAEKNSKIRNGCATTMDDVNLLKCIHELLIGGAETTTTTLTWFVLFMLHYPEVQKKIYKEINEHIGTNMAPNIEDREKLIYLNAVIKETQRFANIAPQSLMRSCTKDIKLKKYTIPKGSFIAPNLDSVLFDDKIFGTKYDVKSFHPERFIDDAGQVKNPEEFIPFGVGRRICLGESMAKTQLFLYIGSIVQRFEILPVDPNQIPPLNHVCAFTVMPEPFVVKLVERIK